MKSTAIIITTIILIQLSGNAQNCGIKIHGLNQESNVAYLGVHNSIDFESHFYMIIDKEFQTTNGVIFSDAYGYKYKPSFIGKSMIKLFQIVDSIKILIDSCEIDVKYLPFTLEIGRHTTYFDDTIEMKKAELLENYFAVLSTNTNLSAMAKIVEFELVVVRNSEVIFKSNYFNYSKSVDLELKNDLQGIRPDDKVHINELKYSYGLGYECRHRNIIIEVK